MIIGEYRVSHSTAIFKVRIHWIATHNALVGFLAIFENLRLITSSIVVLKIVTKENAFKVFQLSVIRRWWVQDGVELVDASVIPLASDSFALGTLCVHLSNFEGSCEFGRLFY